MTTFPAILTKARRRPLALLVLAALGQAAAVAAAAIATRDIFAALASSTASTPYAALAALAFSGVALGWLRIVQAVLAERLGQAFVGELRAELFDHLARAPRERARAARHGGMSLRFVGDLAAIRGWVGKGLPALVSASVVLPAACIAAFVLDLRLGAAIAGPMALGLVTMMVLARRLEPAQRRLRRRRALLSADMSERAPAAPGLRLIGRFGREQALLRRRTRALADAAVTRARAAARMRAIPDAVSAIAATAALSVALTHDLSAAVAAGALAVASLTARPLRELAGVWNRYNAFTVARAKCRRLLLRPTLPHAARKPAPGPLTFENVTHGPVQGVNFVLPEGRSLAVSGPNGAGKSTLLALAAGLEAPRSGHVRIGQTIAVRAASLAGVHLLDADTPILAGSLRRALTLGAPKRPADRLVRKTAIDHGLDPLLRRIGGLDGRIAEAGRNISAGERWRILLARARLAEARILLIDDPDQALDDDALEIVRALMSERQRTILIATNDSRLASLADQCLSLPASALPPQKNRPQAGSALSS